MEKDVYNKIALISNQTNKNLIIQTRDLTNTFWTNLKNNNLEKIENQESLKKLKLPPYSTHIQISIPTEKSKKTLEIVKDYLDNNIKYYEIVEKTKTILHILIDKKEYSKSSIVYYLKSLPAYIKIEVDSRNLL
jgi:primosomal protein N'